MEKHVLAIHKSLKENGYVAESITPLIDENSSPEVGFLIRFKSDKLGALPRSKPARSSRIANFKGDMYRILRDYAFALV